MLSDNMPVDYPGAKNKGDVTKMSIEKVRAYLKEMECPKEILEFETSSATVDLAAQAAGVIPARITKTLCLMSKEGPIVIAVAGDTKIDNRKFKDTFGLKAKMLSPEETLDATGHAVGGVCPFALPETTKAYADISMKRFDTVFPAAGSSNSAVELTCDELFHYGKCVDWVDVCKGWQDAE